MFRLSEQVSSIIGESVQLTFMLQNSYLLSITSFL